MNWKAIARSAIGTSHTKQDIPCQDYSDYKIINDAIIGVVADGAGSAKHSDVGARLAVNTVLEAVTERDIIAIANSYRNDNNSNTQKPNNYLEQVCNLLKNPNRQSIYQTTITLARNKEQLEELFINLVKKVVTALKQEAAIKKYSLDDLACTLLIVIATPKKIAAMQIGDGFITVRYPKQELQLLFPPDKGEYINETTFVTSSNALEDMKVVIQPGQPEFICASTDGLERLAIRLSDSTPFSPFFQPLEQYLRETENLKSDKYLEDFLNSDRLNARTDDDKTLFLCLYDRSDSPQQ